MFYSGAMEGEFDKQGRINLSPTLKKHAGLVKECVIVGVSNRIEIWLRSAGKSILTKPTKVMMKLRKIWTISSYKDGI